MIGGRARTWHISAPRSAGGRRRDKISVMRSRARCAAAALWLVAALLVPAAAQRPQNQSPTAPQKPGAPTTGGNQTQAAPAAPAEPPPTPGVPIYVSPGIVQLARLSGAPIFPLAYSARPRRVLETWDRFILPLPFGRGVFLWGAPMTVPRDADEAAAEDARRMLEDRLNELTCRADAALGQPRIEPAPSLPAAAR